MDVSCALLHSAIVTLGRRLTLCSQKACGVAMDTVGLDSAAGVGSTGLADDAALAAGLFTTDGLLISGATGGLTAMLVTGFAAEACAPTLAAAGAGLAAGVEGTEGFGEEAAGACGAAALRP